MTELKDFNNLFVGQDIFVLGSGATLGFFPEGFFDRRIVVATNWVADHLNLYDRPMTLFTHSHYHEDIGSMAGRHPGHTFFTCEGDQGYAGKCALNLPNVVTYPHRPTTADFTVERAWPAVDGLIVGSTSLHGSMHLAARMGARTVFLAGADCGRVDGEDYLPGYGAITGPMVRDGGLPVLERWDGHLREVKGRIREVFGCAVVSISPFVNPNLEGHSWEGPRIVIESLPKNAT